MGIAKWENNKRTCNSHYAENMQQWQIKGQQNLIQDFIKLDFRCFTSKLLVINQIPNFISKYNSKKQEANRESQNLIFIKGKGTVEHLLSL